MFYKVRVKDHVRVDPTNIEKELEQAIATEVRKKYTGFISKEVGIVVDVIGVQDVGDGIIIPGDGAPYYEAEFTLMVFEPEMHEILPGKVKDIADFGAFLTMGPIDGMVHVSQTMNDYVTYSKDKVLQGRDSERTLKVDDLCIAKIVAISYKDPRNPKFGLTMRSEGLGKLEWVAAEIEKEEKA